MEEEPEEPVAVDEIYDFLRKNRTARLPLDITVLIAIRSAIDKITDEKSSGFGSVTIDICPSHFNKVSCTESVLLPQVKKRRRARAIV